MMMQILNLKRISLEKDFIDPPELNDPHLEDEGFKYMLI